MSFPLTYLLIPYFIFLGVWFILSLVALYHIFRFGGKKVGSVFLVVIYIAGSVGLAILSYTFLSPIPWRDEASVMNGHAPIPAFELPTY